MRTWNRPAVATATALLAVTLLGTAAGRMRAQEVGVTKLNCDETPCDSVARGRAAFDNHNPGQLGGNRRACADCHVPSEHFQLSPAIARARLVTFT